MPVKVAINTRLLKEAQRAGNHRTQKEAVNAALREYILRRKQLAIIELFGTIQYDENYDYKRERSRIKKLLTNLP